MLKLLEAEMKKHEGLTCISELRRSFGIIEKAYDRRWKEISLAQDDEDIEIHYERVEREHDELYDEHREAAETFVEFGGRKMYKLAQANHGPIDSKVAYMIWQIDKNETPYPMDEYRFDSLLDQFYYHLSHIDDQSDPWKEDNAE